MDLSQHRNLKIAAMTVEIKEAYPELTTIEALEMAREIYREAE